MATQDSDQAERLRKAFEAGIEVGAQLMYEKLQRSFGDHLLDTSPHADLLDTPIEDLGLKDSTKKVLDRNGVRTARHLVYMTEADLLAYQLLGQRGLDDVIRTLSECGLHLKR